MDIYQTIIEGGKRKKRDLPLSGFEEGKQLEDYVLSWVRQRSWPSFVNGVFSGQYTHNKNDDTRVDFVGPTAIVGFRIRAKPDFVFNHPQNGYSIVDVKLGPVYPQYLIQAMIVRKLYVEKYGVDPNYYLPYENATRLQRLELQSCRLEDVFTLFCLACMAFQNFNLSQSDNVMGGLFGAGGGSNDAEWHKVFDGSSLFDEIAKKTFNELIKYI